MPEDTKLYLFRELRDITLHWHSIGGHHERLSFNLIDLVGYAGRSYDRPPYHLYNAIGYDTNLADLPIPAIDRKKEYETIEAAKAAGEAYALRWLEAAGKAPVIWTANDTGVHWQANADGVHIGNYYYSDGTLPMPDGNKWHKDFRVWFGGTYYVIKFASTAAARAEVERTWRQWLAVAKERLLNPQPKPADQQPVYRNLVLGDKLQVGDEGLQNGKWVRIADGFAGGNYIPGLMVTTRRSLIERTK